MTISSQEQEFAKIATFIIKLGAVLLVVLILGIKTIEIVPEGHRDVVKRFGKATRQLEPGFNLLIPFVESVTRHDVREKKVNVELASATREQLPIVTEISFNWRIDETQVIDIFKLYGSPDLFFDRIVKPRVAQSAKEAFGKFGATEIIQKRGIVAQDMRDRMAKAMKDFPVFVSSGIINNIKLPAEYKRQVEAKENAREQSEREKHVLEKQRIESQQKVNTANAQAEAKRVEADAEAYKIKVITEALNERGQAYERYPELLTHERIEKWNGTLPRVTGVAESSLLIQPEK